jgi:hypothetical protein
MQREELSDSCNRQAAPGNEAQNEDQIWQRRSQCQEKMCRVPHVFPLEEASLAPVGESQQHQALGRHSEPPSFSAYASVSSCYLRASVHTPAPVPSQCPSADSDLRVPKDAVCRSTHGKIPPPRPRSGKPTGHLRGRSSWHRPWGGALSAAPLDQTQVRIHWLAALCH